MIPNRPTGPRPSKAGSFSIAHPAGGTRPTFGRVLTRLRYLPARLLAILIRWQDRASQRSRLRDLDERMLRDTGLTRADVDRKAGLPFWLESPPPGDPRRRRC